jgi:hypothetical protein
MSQLMRIFGKGKPGIAATERFRKATAPVDTQPRPVRAMAYREASVTYESGYVRRGIVLDYSDSGVRMRFQTNEGLSPQVKLNAFAVGVQGVAEVVWQHGSEAGLKLVG